MLINQHKYGILNLCRVSICFKSEVKKFMYYYDFGNHQEILLEFHTPDGLLPPAYQGRAFFRLESRDIKSQIYMIAGNQEKFGLGICFGQGSKDSYAALIILYVNGQGYVYYPWDAEWLSVFDCVSAYASKKMVLDTLMLLMQRAVGRSEVFSEDFVFIQDVLKCYIQYPAKIYWSMFYWSVWFFYACVAEERYVSPSGFPTIFGGLIKIVAWIEHAFEGWNVKDACDHYKRDCYKAVYNGTYPVPSYEVIDKCKRYGIERKV